MKQLPWDDPAPRDLGRRVDSLGELDGPDERGAATLERRRVDVSDGDGGDDALASRIAQQRAVAAAQRQRPVERQPREVRCQRADAHRHAGGAECRTSSAGISLRSLPLGRGYVDDPRQQIGSGVSKASPRATSDNADPAQVQRHPRDRRDLVLRAAERLQPAHVHPPRAVRAGEFQLVADAGRCPAPRVPVTTVPAPPIVNARSTQSRTRPLVTGAGQPFAAAGPAPHEARAGPRRYGRKRR